MHYESVIIGAGFAGLHFAHKFKLKNFIILEKNNRIGGRVYNIKWNNEQISLGGGILRIDDTSTLNLINEFNLEIVKKSNKFYFIDLEGQDPNEELFYEPNKIIISYLKKLFEKNRDYIKKFKLTFRQFLYEYLEYHVAEIIISNLLYLSYLESDVETIFEEKIYQLMRIKPFFHFYIKPDGYTSLLNKLIESIGESNIKLETSVIEITRSDNKYIVKCEGNIIYTCDKLVLATEKNPKIKINFQEVNNLYEMFGTCQYFRSYGYFRSGHGISNPIKTHKLPGKILVSSKNILMTSYTENFDASEMKELFENKEKEDQLSIINNLLINTGLKVNRPDDFIYIYWNVGTHYPKPNFNFDSMKNAITKLAKEDNIYLVGEVFSDCHGWVNCAFESVDRLYDELTK